MFFDESLAKEETPKNTIVPDPFNASSSAVHHQEEEDGVLADNILGRSSNSQTGGCEIHLRGH